MDFTCAKCGINTPHEESVEINDQLVCRECADCLDNLSEKVALRIRYLNDHADENIISTDYSERIANAIAAEVADDIIETASPDWNDDDLRLAVGRVLCKRLGIEI